MRSFSFTSVLCSHSALRKISLVYLIFSLISPRLTQLRRKWKIAWFARLPATENFSDGRKSFTQSTESSTQRPYTLSRAADVLSLMTQKDIFVFHLHSRELLNIMVAIAPVVACECNWPERWKMSQSTRAFSYQIRKIRKNNKKRRACVHSAMFSCTVINKSFFLSENAAATKKFLSDARKS